MKSLTLKITNIQSHLDHIEEKHSQILHRLDRIEGKLEMQINPAKYLDVAEKGEIMRKAVKLIEVTV